MSQIVTQAIRQLKEKLPALEKLVHTTEFVNLLSPRRHGAVDFAAEAVNLFHAVREDMHVLFHFVHVLLHALDGFGRRDEFVVVFVNERFEIVICRADEKKPFAVYISGAHPESEPSSADCCRW